jgi:hypothetical protein
MEHRGKVGCQSLHMCCQVGNAFPLIEVFGFEPPVVALL